MSPGDVREWTTFLSRRDPHKVLRITRDEVLIKYSDRTTEWWPLVEYISETQVVDSNSDL